jgi:hypothetical protein
VHNLKIKISNLHNRLIADKFQENKNNLRRFKVLLKTPRPAQAAQTIWESRATRAMAAHLKSLVSMSQPAI